MSLSNAIRARLTAPKRDEPVVVWQKAQEAIKGVIGEEKLNELLELGLGPEKIEVRPVFEFDREKRKSTGDLVGHLGLSSGDEVRIILFRLLGNEVCKQVLYALEHTFVSRIVASEYIYDPVACRHLLREEAPKFLNGYLRQVEELASALGGEPTVLIALTRRELNCIGRRERRDTYPFESVDRKLKLAAERMERMLDSAFLKRPPAVLPRKVDESSADDS